MAQHGLSFKPFWFSFHHGGVYGCPLPQENGTGLLPHLGKGGLLRDSRRKPRCADSSWVVFSILQSKIHLTGVKDWASKAHFTNSSPPSSIGQHLRPLRSPWCLTCKKDPNHSNRGGIAMFGQSPSVRGRALLTPNIRGTSLPPVLFPVSWFLGFI